MAVAYRGGYNDGGDANPTSGTWSLSGTNAVAGDFAVCVWYSRANTKTITPTGPTLITNQDASTANGGHIWVGYKAVTAADVTAGNVGTWTGSSVSNGTTGTIVAVFSGVDTSLAATHYATPTAGGAGDPDPPSINTTSGNTLIAIFGEMDQNDGVSAPTNFTLAANAAWSTTKGTDGSSAVAYDLDGGTGSAVNPTVFTTTTDAYWYTTVIEVTAEHAPTVSLGTPDDNASLTDTTPDLKFTGTDLDSDLLAYEVQVDTAVGFNSQSGGTVTYYIDGSDAAVTDPNSVWTNDSNLTNHSGSLASCSVNTSGSATSNYLKAEGTNAPSGYSTITQVRARVYGGVTTTTTTHPTVNAAIYTDGKGELLGTPTMTSTSNTEMYGSYVVLAAPAAGWTWATVQALEVFAYITAGSADYIGSVGEVQIEVTWSAYPIIDVFSTDKTGFTTDDDGLYSSGTEITYTVQSSLSPNTYYWRVRAKDPSGSNAWGAWSPGDSTLGYDHFHLPDVSLDQTEAAFYEDGTESASVEISGGANSITRTTTTDSNILLRFRIQESAGGTGLATDDYQLQYSVNSGTFVNVGSAYARIADQCLDTAMSGIGLASDAQWAEGQSFTGNGHTLDSVVLRLSKSSLPTGNATINIYAHSGSYGASSIPTGDPLSTTTYDVATIPVSATDVTIPFSGGNRITLNKSTYYCVSIEYNGGTFAGNHINVFGNAPSPSHLGNYFSKDSSGVWVASSERDLRFIIQTAPIGVIGYNSTNLTDGDVTTNRLGSGTGSFEAGKISEDGLVDNLQINPSTHTELLYSLTLTSTQLENDDTIDFKILRNGIAIGGYSVVPRITVSKITSAIKKISGIAQTSIKKINGVVIASVKKVSGVANT